LGVVLAPLYKPCIRSSEPFVGACDLGASSAALAADRRNRPVLLWLLLSAVHHKVVEEL
jgi:hypothetical protein